MAEGGWDKCTCCGRRYAIYNVREKCEKKISNMYCEECSEAHRTSEKYPGGKLIYTVKNTPPEDPVPKKLPRQEEQECECCEYYYKKEAAVKMLYECMNPKHNAIYCLNCTEQHQTCRVDHDPATSDSEDRFHELLEKHEKEDKNESEDNSDEDDEENSDEDDEENGDEDDEENSDEDDEENGDEDDEENGDEDDEENSDEDDEENSDEDDEENSDEDDEENSDEDEIIEEDEYEMIF